MESQLLDAVNMTNYLLSGIILFLGVISGLILAHHFFGRFRK